MIHPHTELRFISEEKGYGVVASKFIPKGTMTWVLDKLDRTFTPRELTEMEPVYQAILRKYTYRDGNGHYVLCWDNARFVNHSFNSNCISTAYNFELAVRDIFPGEELTDDYGYLNCEQSFYCLPEANTSRIHVQPDDLLHYYKEWDNKLFEAFKYYKKVEQPLSQFVEYCCLLKVEAIATGLEKMDSILNLFFSDNQELMQLKQEFLHGHTYA
jgi:hypothetical protein